MRPTGDYTSLQNVSPFRRLRTTEDNSLFNQFLNMVSLGPWDSRSTGRVYLEERPRNRPPHRQDEGPGAGGVSRYRPEEGIHGSPLPVCNSPFKFPFDMVSPSSVVREGSHVGSCPFTEEGMQ